MPSTNAKRSYRLISADSHVNEPGDLWTKRLPAAFKDRAPYIKSFDEGDAWIIEGMKEPMRFGWTSCAGLPPEKMTAWVRFEDMRAGGYNPKVRCEEMDADGVDAEALYPTPALQIAMCSNTDEAYHLALVRAYNDWLSEYVSYAPERFAGMALIPNRGGAKAAIEEINRVVGRPGMRGVVMGCYPNGTLQISPEDDPVWALLQERDITLTIHVALTQSMPAVTKTKLPGYGRFFDAPNRVIEMAFSGMFDRFPKLRVFWAETDFGWLPYVKEQIDNNYRRLEPTQKFGLKRMPSEYVADHCYFGYMTDTFGLDHREYIGADRILWSSDYPHISADWPYSWRTIQASFSGIPTEEREMILHGNAERLFGFAR
jgi:predicted TIM-barrel fold metal-dependent hydrolase